MFCKLVSRYVILYLQMREESEKGFEVIFDETTERLSWQ